MGVSSKEDRRRQKELEEARKAGLAEPEVRGYIFLSVLLPSCLYMTLILRLFVSLV